MGFSWTSLIAPSNDYLQKVHMQELITNISTVEGNLGVAGSGVGWVWSGGMNPFDPSDDKKLESSIVGGVGEIREATDNLDDQNFCRTHFLDKESDYLATHHQNYDDAQKVTEYNDRHGTYLSGHEYLHDTTYNYGYDTTYHDNYDNDQHWTHRDGHFPGYDYAVDTGLNLNFDDTIF